MSEVATRLDAPAGLSDTHAQRASEETSKRARVGAVRAWLGQRRGRAVLGTALLLAVLLGVLAYVIAHSQSTSRSETQQRFEAQATITAGLTHALLGIVESQGVQEAEKKFSGQVSTAQLNLMVRQSHDAYLILTTANGTVLVASAGTPSGVITSSPQVSFALDQAKHGKPWFSDVVRGSNGTPLIVEAVPFSTPTGERVALAGTPVATLWSLFSDFLKGAVGPSSSGLIVDSAGRALGSWPTNIRPGEPIKAGLRPALRNSGGGVVSASGDRFLATAPIATSKWRVAISEPGSALYPTLVGSRGWVLWLVFAALAVAGLLGVFLLARVLSGAARVSLQAQEIQRANDALAKANAELDAFSYSVSHDLRAPLRAIDGFSRILIEEGMEQLDEEQQRYLGLVRSNTQKMGELIDDLLALSRVGSRPLERQTVDVHNLVAEVRASFADEIAGREVEFTIGDLPQIQGDRALLRQVLQNLIGNALKYSRERSPARVSVSAASEGDQTVFSVRDNGVGFDMRYANKLFEVFQRLHRAEDYEGTGVGLAIVARIISRHDGRVWADSSPGEGATFYFTLGADAT